MENNRLGLSVRIISGSPAEAERLVNELLDQYSPMVWNIQPSGEGALVTVVLIHERELRKAQLAASPGMQTTLFKPRGN